MNRITPAKLSAALSGSPTLLKKIRNWLRGPQWRRLTVTYDHGEPLYWITKADTPEMYRHIPQLGEVHGDQVVVGWNVERIKRPRWVIK